MRAAATATLLLVSCSPVDTTIEPPDLDWNRMLVQPRYESYASSEWFDDHAAMRLPPEGTVAFREDGTPAEDPRPTLAVLERGRREFEQICAACHGVAGDGNTPVAERMELRPAPSLHTDKARGFTDEALREIVRDGYGLMPSYAQHLDRHDRFAVVYYLRALQLSQHALMAELPPEVRRNVLEAAR